MLATATSFTPGPNTTLSTALAVNGGLRHALKFVLAVPVGWALLLLLSALGVGSLIQTWPLLRGAIVLAGVAYLLWLAWRHRTALSQTMRTQTLLACAQSASRGLDLSEAELSSVIENAQCGVAAAINSLVDFQANILNQPSQQPALSVGRSDCLLSRAIN